MRIDRRNTLITTPPCSCAALAAQDAVGVTAPDCARISWRCEYGRAVEVGVGLRDVTGVFSRFFVVGFFVPCFVAVFVVAALFADADANTDNEVLVVGGVALVLALVLVGLRQLVWEAFEDWPPNSYFGRKTHEYHCRIQTRWGLDVYRSWPMIQPLFSEREVELDIDGRSDVHFFLNCCLGGVGVGVALVIDAFGSSPVSADWWASAVLGVVAFLGAALSYVAAARAVMPWGDFKEAAVVLHLAELCKQFGIEFSPGGDEGRRAAREVNKLLEPEDSDGRRWHRRGC